MKTVAVLLGLCLAVFSAPAGAGLAVGATPPDLLGKTPEGDEIRISQFRGRVMVVTFWASWCGPCRRELPVLDQLQRVAGERAKVVAVNVKDTPQDYRLIRRQLKDAALTFTYDRSGEIAQGYAVKAYPNLYVIDQRGAIAAVHVGFGDESLAEIVEDINALLEAPPKPVASN